MSPTLDDLLAAYRGHYWLPDPSPLLAVLATVAANRMAGDPLWLLVVGPPSSGKSELLGLTTNLPETFAVDTLTEGGLLSGAPGEGNGGLLPEMAARVKAGASTYGLAVVSDLSSLLGGASDTRERVFGLLRRVFDGRPVTRRVGTAGGLTVEATVKVGLLGAVTGAIDLLDFAQLGDRFVYLRLPAMTAEDEATTLAFAGENAGRSPENRAELAEVAAAFFAGLALPEGPKVPSAEDHERLAALARIGARCRSAVPRDGSGAREVLALLQPEVPTRLFMSLVQLLAGLRAIGAREDGAWPVVVGAALGGLTAARRAVVDSLYFAPFADTTAAISDRIGLPRTTTQRALEDLAAVRALVREDDPADPRRPSHWEVDAEMRRLLDAHVYPASPEEATARRLVESAFPEAGEAPW